MRRITGDVERASGLISSREAPLGDSLDRADFAPLRRVDCAGFSVHVGRQEDYLQFVAQRVRKRQKVVCLNHNLHSLYHYFTDERLRNIYDRST